MTTKDKIISVIATIFLLLLIIFFGYLVANYEGGRELPGGPPSGYGIILNTHIQ